MFIDDAHILRASSSTVWACTSKRPAIARIECGSVIKRVGMLPISFWTYFLDLSYRSAVVIGPQRENRSRRSRVEHRQSFPSHSTGRRRMRYHTACPWHLEAGFGFAFPLAPFRPLAPLINAFSGDLRVQPVGHLSIDI